MYVMFPFIVNEEAEIFTYFLIIIKLVSEQAGDPENSLPLDQLFALYVVYFELREHLGGTKIQTIKQVLGAHICETRNYRAEKPTGMCH